jgi:hypothetical protein
MEKQIFKIRFNNQAADGNEQWRIIDPKGQETLVKDVIIQVGCCTTEDWMEDTQEFKYHITCMGKLTLKEQYAVIS